MRERKVCQIGEGGKGGRERGGKEITGEGEEGKGGEGREEVWEGGKGVEIKGKFLEC